MGSPDFSVLFEPYSTRLYPGSIISTTDQGDGTALVCRTIEAEYKFQPGFSYSFPDSVSPDPAAVPAAINQIPVINHAHEAFNITIAEINTNCAVSNTASAGICTRGQMCTVENFKGGKITSSPNLIDLNSYTIENLDEIKVKNPQLFETLMSNQYHKVEKETDSGAKIIQIFFKQ
jgi:hypothetical protein